jgi:hypothetical protein
MKRVIKIHLPTIKKTIKMKNTFLILFALAVLITSCDQENIGTVYDPGAPYVAFSSPVVSNNILTSENNFSVNVQIVRSDLNTSTTAEVSLEMNDNIDGVFALENSTITFDEGKAEAYVNIIPVVGPSEIDPTKSYVFKLTITSDNASELYNTTTYKASFKYTPIGTGNFVSSFDESEWPVDIEKLEVGDITLYKAKGLYESGYDVTIIVEGNNVTINEQPAWFYDNDYGDVFIAGSGTANGKVLTMSIEHYIPDVGGWDPATEILTLP